MSGPQPQDWDWLKPKLEELATKLDTFSLVCRRHPLRMNLQKAREAKDLAHQCRRLARRTLTWPGLSDAGRKGEWFVALEQYRTLQRKSWELLGDWAPKD